MAKSGLINGIPANEYCKQWRAAHPEYVARQKVLREARADIVRKNSREWYLRNREYAIAKAAAWGKANPERKRELDRQRRARQKLKAHESLALGIRPPHTDKQEVTH